jgi:hypothetical protein
VLGPPDGLRLPGYCQDSVRPWDRYEYQPLDDWERSRYKDLIRSKDGPLCRWHEPPNVAPVRDIQRRVAKASGLAFWDWQAFMGGPGAVHQWALAKPSLAVRDHVHLQETGYQASADALFTAIMREYDKTKAGSAKKP